MIDVKEAAHEKEGSEFGDAYSFDSERDAQRMEDELIDKLQDDTPKHCAKGTYKHFNGMSIDVDSATNTIESFDKPKAQHRTQINSPVNYNKNPDFGFKNELIHDLRRDNTEPKNWGLMYQLISG